MNYKLSATDPEIEQIYLGKDDGDYELKDVVVCVSLAEVWNDYAFRVIASVITEQRCN